MSDLADRYSYKAGRVEKDTWFDIIGKFRDVNIYQTWSYEAKRNGEKNMSHLILSHGDAVVAAAQVRLLDLPFLGTGIAYVRWGPLCNIRVESKNLEVFRQALRALRNEYVFRRKFLLRVYPLPLEVPVEAVRSIFESEGYVRQAHKTGNKTLLLDIRPPLQELRKNLDQKWRNCLNHAERNNLEILEGEDDQLFGFFVRLYAHMIERKGFPPPNNISDFREVQKDLPNGWKSRIFLCRDKSGFGAGAICSALGDTGVYLYGATDRIGMANKGSYLLQWRILQWLKDVGCVDYDLNGIDPNLNPGTHRFKAGIAGKAGREVQSPGAFDSYTTAQGRLLSSWGDGVFSLVRKYMTWPKRGIAVRESTDPRA